MSASPRELTLVLVEATRERARLAEREAAEWLALARAGARVGKSVPDGLLAEVRRTLASGELADKLRRRVELPAGADLPPSVYSAVGELLAEQAERAAELLTDVTQAAAERAAELRGRAFALWETATLMVGLANSFEPPDPPAPPEGTP